MSKFQAVQKIRKEDLQNYSDPVPDWIDALIDPINSFMDTVSVGLKKGLTLDDNFNGIVKTVDFTHAVEKNIDPQTTKTIVGVIPITTGALRIDSFGFRFASTQTRQIAVTISFDGGTSTTVGTCTLFIFTK